jgi:hypothetical protein
MVRIRWTFYTGVVLTALQLGAPGCSKPAPPPAGAPKETPETPEVEMGSSSDAPKDTKGAPTDSSPASGTPKDEKGAP